MSHAITRLSADNGPELPHARSAVGVVLTLPTPGVTTPRPAEARGAAHDAGAAGAHGSELTPAFAEGAPMARLFENEALVPKAWKSEQEETAVAAGSEGIGDAPVARPAWRVFNPTISPVAGGYAMAYRVVQDERERRRLATCLLTPALDVVPGSVTPLSEMIGFAAEGLSERAMSWHADPRYFRLLGRLYLTWNDGSHRPRNHQFLMEMAADGLRPAGSAREMTLEFGRQPIEKNWMLFEAQGRAWATYGIMPHEVLALDLDDPLSVTCGNAYRSHWPCDYVRIYGEMRGGAQAVPFDEGLLALAHSSYKAKGGRVYRACFYAFRAAPPFAPSAASVVPVELPNPKGPCFDLPRLNAEVAEVVYPCGFVLAGEDAVVSYGINDEVCAVARLPLAAIRRGLAPVRPALTLSCAPPATRSAAPAVARRSRPRALPQVALPMFWWDSAGKGFDGSLGQRVFATGNFGDIASMEIVRRAGGCPVRQARPGERKLLAIGSVLHTARNGDIIWGAGLKGSKAQLDKKVRELSVHAVRGPLTVDFLRRAGIDLSRLNEVFDPGCLMPLLYRKEIASLGDRQDLRRGGIRIVPHYRDDLMMRREHFRLLDDFVSVDTTPLGMVEQLIGADQVISSSLHGIIFAEALGIPALWLAPRGEDELKYYDYYYGTGRYAVRRFAKLEDALGAEPMPLPRFRLEDYLATFPHEEIEALRAPGLRVGKTLDLRQGSEQNREEFGEFVGFGRQGREGRWMIANRARLRTQALGTTEGETLEVRLVVHPFNPPQFAAPQRLEASLGRDAVAVAEWAPGVKAPAEIVLRTRACEGTTPLDLLLVTRNARSPRSLGHSEITERLAVCLGSVSIARVALAGAAGRPLAA